MKKIECLTVIGVGLIGGSFALALKKAGLVEWVVGYGRSAGRLDKALQLGVIDEASYDLSDCCRSADLVLAACPVGAMQTVFSVIAPSLRSDVIITDGGSTKLSVIEAARNGLGDRIARFVPGHPIAGSEQSGVEAAFADLYQKHRVLITPLAENSQPVVDRVTELWQATGASVSVMDADQHDRILGMTSHLPHVLAYTLVHHMASQPDSEACFNLAAGGFLDFTRIASSDPVMWRDVALYNRQQLINAIDGFGESLNILRRLVASGEGQTMENLFRDARDARNRLIDQRRNA